MIADATPRVVVPIAGIIQIADGNTLDALIGGHRRGIGDHRRFHSLLPIYRVNVSNLD